MNKKPKAFVIFIGICLVYWAGKYVWLDPEWSQSRLEKIISIGQSVKEVNNLISINKPFRINSTYPCGKNIEGVKFIALYDSGSLLRYSLLTVYVTTTTLCFDTNDILIGMETSRWIDGP